jgi:F-type H+-transporting ATPase subunit b
VQLDWSTLLLEVINFLVLVWILKRFLYKPVLDAIARRKASIDKTLSDAQAKQAEAKTLEQQYQNRLGDWEQEKDGLRRTLTGELQAQRERLTEELQGALAKEREKETVLAERRLAELETRAAQKGTLQGVQFTERLLERIASAEVEARLVKVALDDLPHLPDAQKEALRSASSDSQRPVNQRVIKVTSAFPLPEKQRQAVIEGLKSATGQDVTFTFQEDASLLAGVRISVGPWVLRANLQDELAFFAERARNGK